MSTIGLLFEYKRAKQRKKINLYLLLIFPFLNHSLLNWSELDLYCKLNILTVLGKKFLLINQDSTVT